MYRWEGIIPPYFILKTFKLMLDTKHKLCYIIDTTKQGNTYKEVTQNGKKVYNNYTQNTSLQRRPL